MNEATAIASIDLQAINTNYDLLKELAPQKMVMAVVKANAYGHGSVEVARSLEKHGAHFFGVARISEAIALRKANIKKPILIFGYTPSTLAIYLKEFDLIQTVTSFKTAEELSRICPGVRVHLKIDTGMARYGITLRDETDLELVAKEAAAIYNLPNLDCEGIYTHFADSSGDLEFTKKQYSLFARLLKMLEASGINPGIRHAANSGAAIWFKESHLDMIRSGIALYGLPPLKTDQQFIPALTLEAMVVDKHRVHQGESVSYNRTFKAQKDLEVATLGLGYADGYFRQLSNKDHFCYGKRKLKQIGTVCMDALMVDATGIDLKIGDYVEIYGKNRTAHDLAELAGTISYEILTSISERVKRVYY